MSDERRTEVENMIKEKVDTLGKELHAQDDRFTLIKNQDITRDRFNDRFIRFTDGGSKVKIYVEYANDRFYSNSSYGINPDKYYVRLSSEDHYGQDVNFKHTWTFTKTEDLLQKVHDKAIQIANRVNDKIEYENEVKRRTNKAVKHIQTLFDTANEYGHRGNVSFRLEKEKTPTVSVEYCTNREQAPYYNLEVNYLTEEQALRIAEILGHPPKK